MVVVQESDFYPWTSNLAPEIQLHIGELLRYYPKGHSAFRQLLIWFDRRKIIIPSYSIFQDIFSRAFTDEDRRLKTLITSIPESIGEQLTALIERDDG